MAVYTFYLRGSASRSDHLEYPWVDTDGVAFEVAGRLLDRHPICECVEVWLAERPVAARYRQQPILRPVAPGEISLGPVQYETLGQAPPG